MRKPEQLETLPFVFGRGFLEDHAGHIMSDAAIAITELIANSYDAGATLVDLRWPDSLDGEFLVEDNGTGMTSDEFVQRWKTLGYKRTEQQGPNVTFPPGIKAKPREAFGQSGKGRHGAFCFSNTYVIETWKDGDCLKVQVDLVDGGKEPFHCKTIDQSKKDGQGTRISAQVQRHLISFETLCETVGSKFLVDPEFQIRVNGKSLVLLSLTKTVTSTLEIPEHGSVTIHFVEAPQQDRTSKLRGITWWVHKRMVGEPSWSGLDQEGAILDRRSAAAKRYSFIVEADQLKPDVKSDWSGFHETSRFQRIREAVRSHVTGKLDELLSKTRKERKIEILGEHRSALKQLTPLSQRVVGEFVDEVNKKCPSISDGDLSKTVEVLAKLEQSRDGFDLLNQLANCSPDDLDRWNGLMKAWTARNAEIVLGELGRRLKLIGDLEELVDKSTTKELQELQPLFAQGLWMFGPEFESPDFTSNRTMATVVRTLLGGADDDLSKKRPDIVVLPDTSIGFYSADQFNEENEVSGLRSVIIVELKKGGFELTTKEMRQAEDYCIEIRKANLVQATTRVTAFVLGSTLQDAEERTLGQDNHTRIMPLPYSILLRKAHARTFHLKKKLELAVPRDADPEVKEVVETPVQQEFAPMNGNREKVVEADMKEVPL